MPPPSRNSSGSETISFLGTESSSNNNNNKNNDNTASWLGWMSAAALAAARSFVKNAARCAPLLVVLVILVVMAMTKNGNDGNNANTGGSMVKTATDHPMRVTDNNNGIISYPIDALANQVPSPSTSSLTTTTTTYQDSSSSSNTNRNNNALTSPGALTSATAESAWSSSSNSARSGTSSYSSPTSQSLSTITTSGIDISPELVEELFPSGWKRPADEYSATYLPRSPERHRHNIPHQQTWGSWTIQPKKHHNTRIPRLDTLYEQYPNRDVPRNQFPIGAWQTDTVYLETFLLQALALTNRSMEAILAEYGHSILDEPQRDLSERSFMFALTTTGSGDKCNTKLSNGNAGCIHPQAAADIKRSLLHAIMTESSWIFAMGGHSSSAGHGNHFPQSYTLQVQKILEPVLARLGVFHQSHNYGMGGLGTIQNSLGAGSLYGNEIDVLMWDSGMTEGDDGSKDIFVRQGVLGGNRVPVIWGDNNAFGYSEQTNMGGVMTGYWGSGFAGVSIAHNYEDFDKMPYAAQFLNCEGFWKECRDVAYDTACWVDRSDGFVPPKIQNPFPGGRAKWHPGWRYHQLEGRMIAYNILRYLQEGLQEWYEAESFALPDEAWHVSERYASVRQSVLSWTNSSCYDYNGMPTAICEIPMRAASEFTPRSKPYETTIRNLIKPGSNIPQPKGNCYDPPDVELPFLNVPDSAVDAVAIIESGVDFAPNPARRAYIRELIQYKQHTKTRTLPPLTNPQVVFPGQGWGIDSPGAPDNCDGTYNSFCNRACDNDCLLEGHNDYRGGLLFDSLSGWLVLNIPAVQRGLIIVKVDDWLGMEANPATEGWICENNACGASNRQRYLKGQDPTNYKCNDFIFEFAINGKVTSWSRSEFEANRYLMQRLVTGYVLLDDPSFTHGQKQDVEVAMRLTGPCARQVTFALTHVYWS